MILVTGGTGYIGSHTCVALAQAGHDIVIVDNLGNSRVSVIDRLETLCGKRPKFIHGDIRDAALLDRIFADHPIQAVVHFAGLKAVGESAKKAFEPGEVARPCLKPIPPKSTPRSSSDRLWTPLRLCRTQALHRLAQKTLRQRAHVLGLDARGRQNGSCDSITSANLR